MRLTANNLPELTVLYQCLCVFCLFLLWGSLVLTALIIRQKRYRWLAACIPLLLLSYLLEQCFDCRVSGAVFSDRTARFIDSLFALPDFCLLLFCLILFTAEILLLCSVHRFGINMITPMSVKEAMDNLPAGILCYASKARALLINRTMQRFCRTATGEELIDGETFVRTLREGDLHPGCRRVLVGDESLFVLPDGTVWKFSETDALYEKHMIHIAITQDITEEYRKTLELQEMQKKVEKLGAKLQTVNHEIVALTADREMLNAKVRIHDEFGSNLLAIRRFLTRGGTKEEKSELAEALKSNVTFLKNDTSPTVRDEYELLLSMSARLGLEIVITGDLPQNEPNKAIMATAIHECMTNTLRHAHGDRLCVSVTEEGNFITAVLTNNGDTPKGEIVEKGGLAALRELTEQAGGKMSIAYQPVYSVMITLPKGDEYGI